MVNTKYMSLSAVKKSVFFTSAYLIYLPHEMNTEKSKISFNFILQGKLQKAKPNLF